MEGDLEHTVLPLSLALERVPYWGGALVLSEAFAVLQACGPLWSHECGSSYFSTGICSRVNASFKFSRTIAPAFQSKHYVILFPSHTHNVFFNLRNDIN